MPLQQTLVSGSTPEEFRKKLNEHLESGWLVVPHTHVAQWVNVATGSTYIAKESKDGYFAIVVESRFNS